MLNMKIFSLAILLFLVTGLSYAQSRESPKDKPTKSAEQKQDPSTYQRGTKDLPVVIEIAPPNPLNIETDRGKEAENEKAVNEGRIAGG